MPADLHELVRLARETAMTPKQAETQRRSFAYGNIQIENPHVTRDLVDRVADRTPPTK